MITEPELQVISGGLGEGLTEPRRVVELAAGAIRTTPMVIPQRVIGVKNRWNNLKMIAGVTEVILSNE